MDNSPCLDAKTSNKNWTVYKVNEPSMTEDEVGIWVQKLIDQDRLHDFYVSSLWLNLRKEVLAEDKCECQQCKDRGWYKKADTVHHRQYVRKHPRLALSKFYMFQGKEVRNLVSLCHDCHEEV